MAKEYIERDAAIKHIRNVAAVIGFENPAVAVDSCVTVLERLSSADVVEVVRCKDCRSSRPLNRNDRLENRYGDGCVWCMTHSDGMREDDFCSDGERR